MNYEAALAYIDQFIDYERSREFARQTRLYNLNRISQLLDLLGNPQNRLRVIHIAGSKGKGSTAALIASVLRCAGYKTGLFTSPHLITPRERCRIDGRLISEEDVTLYILEKLKSAIETVSDSEFGRVSFFEIYTALAFCYFADKAVDFAVVEVGLGGRLDATNIVSPVTTVITRLGWSIRLYWAKRTLISRRRRRKLLKLNARWLLHHNTRRHKQFWKIGQQHGTHQLFIQVQFITARCLAARGITTIL